MRTGREGYSQDVLYGRRINTKRKGSKKINKREWQYLNKILNDNRWCHCPESEGSNKSLDNEFILTFSIDFTRYSME